MATASPAPGYTAQAEHVEALIRRAIRRGTRPYRRYVGELEQAFLVRHGLAEGSMTPSREATLLWLDGMIRGATTATAGGYSWAYQEAAAVWDRARDEGLVEGSRTEMLARLIAERTGRPPRAGRREQVAASRLFASPSAGLTAEMLQDLLEWISTAQTERLMEQQSRSDRAMLADLGETLERERRRGASTEEQKRAVEKAAKRYGTADGLRAGFALLTFLTTVLLPRFQESIRDAFRSELVRPAFPYLRYATRQDDRVRPNHAALEGFVAESDWEGWRIVEPPNGWRCRCRTIPVTWEEALARGWSGRFPLGVAKLEAFFALGGPDPSFPKASFQVAA